MSNSDLSDVLVLPQVTQHKRKREAVNSRAKCVTDDDILGELKAKEQEKMEKIQEKEKNKAEIQRRKEEAMKKKAARETQVRKIRGQKSRNKAVLQQLQNLSLTSSESEAECPDCGLVYGDDDSTWVQCDSCGLWRDLKCAGVTSVSDIPEIFCCQNCV